MDKLTADVATSQMPKLLDSVSRQAQTKRSNAARLFGYDFFISFALGPPPRGTHSYASDLARRLRERDFTVFFSEDEASPGEHLDSALRDALKNSKALVVIANQATLKEPRWVRKEVEYFRSQHPKRPIIPIFVGHVLQDEVLGTHADDWLAYRDKIWLEESEDAAEAGMASEILVNRLALVSTKAKSNVRWRWVVRSIQAILIILAGAAITFAWQANKNAVEAKRQSDRAVKGENRAKENEATAIANEKKAKKQETLAKANLEKAEEQERIAKDNAHEARRQRDEAIIQRRNAESREYSARSLLAVESNPAEALRLAIRAGELGDNSDSEAALRRAIGVSHLEGILSHEGGITDTDFASNQIVTTGNDGNIRFWETATGRPLSVIPAGLKSVRGRSLRVVVSPDATRAAVWGGFSEVSIWDVIAKRELHRFDTFDQTVHVDFSPGGEDVLAVHGGSVTLRRTQDGNTLRRAGETVLSHAALSQDRRLLAVASHDGRSVMIYDATTGADGAHPPSGEVSLRHLSTVSTGGSTRRVAISADGRWLAALSQAPAPGFTLWHIADPRKPVRYDRMKLDLADVRIESIVFFPQSLRLAMGSSDGVVRIWKENGKGEWELVSSLRGHTAPVRDIAVSRSGSILASASMDGTARVWNTPGSMPSATARVWNISGSMRSVARGHRGPVYKVRLSDDGRRMVTIGGADGRALLWDTFPDREVATIGPLFSSNLIFGPSLSEIKQVALDSRAMRLVLLAEDTPYVFSRQDNRLMPIGSRILIFDRYKAVCVSPDGRFVLLTGPGNEPSIHNVDTGEPVLMLRGHTESVSVAQYNQSATRVVTVGEDRTLRVWDVASGKQLASMETGDKPALAAIFSPDGRHVVSTGEAPKVWSADGRFVAALGGSFSAMFNDDGTKLWTTTANAARAWNTRNWRLQAEVLSPFRFNYRTIPLRGDYILFSENKTGQIQLVAPQNQAKILVGHKATVTAAALSPDHSRLITGDETGKVIVWLTSTGAVTSEISDHTSHVTTISFSRNGRFFATGSKDGTVRLYALAVNDLLQLARSRLPNGMATGSGGEK